MKNKFFFPPVELKFKEGEASEIQVLSIGVWQHPYYGKITIGEEEVKEFIKNFNDEVRRELPITEGHSVGEEEKPAIGWFDQLINKGREGLFAIIEWNNEGKRLLKEKAYKYFSPEFYTLYEDPETRKKYKNVLCGGALTNKPYFKSLQAVTLSEFTFFEGMKLEEILNKEASELTDEEVEFLKDNKNELTEEQKEKFEEAIKEGDEEGNKEEVQGGEKVIKERTFKILERNAQEGVRAMAELRKQKATTYVGGLVFSESNKEGPFLEKGQGKVVEFMLSLTESQQEKFKEIIADLPKANLFGEFGKELGKEVSVDESIQKIVEKKMSEDKELTYAVALDEAIAENPALAEKLL